MPLLPSPLLALSVQDVIESIQSIPWLNLLHGIGGQLLGITVGFVVSWFVLMRKRRLALARLMRGDSDDILYQSHHLSPIAGTDKFILLFRNIAPSTKVDRFYDNPAANQIIRELVQKTTLQNPVLKTEGTLGFEVLNDAFIHIAGHLATTSFDREVWLFTMTCEDRQVVRRRCIRCFLIRPRDLERFTDWDWCREHIHCEQPWHWYRIVALHQIAKQWKAERAGNRFQQGVPLVDNHATHNRIRELSAGIFTAEVPIGPPVDIPWEKQEAELKKLGLSLKLTEPVPRSVAPGPKPLAPIFPKTLEEEAAEEAFLSGDPSGEQRGM